MSPILQDNRPMRATTPLGDNVLIPVAVSGTEWVSRLFQFTVDFVSEKSDVTSDDLIAQGVTLKLERADGEFRHIHGQVSRFVQLGTQGYFTRYRAELVPKFSFLALSDDCRTFEDKSVRDIVETVCGDAGVGVTFRVAASLSPIPYVVQYRESNLAFVSRLLEAAGLYYVFEHSDGAHSLVVSDAAAGTIAQGDVSPVQVQFTQMAEDALADRVFGFRREFGMHTAKVEVADHALLRRDNVGSVDGSGRQASGERFDFVGDLGPDDSATIARTRIEEEEHWRDVIYGQSNCPSFQAGTRVTLSDCPGGGDVEVHLLSVSHRYEVGDVVGGSGQVARYANEFMAIPAATKYRPPRSTPRPSVRGTQLAKVVGTGGDGAIDVDKDGCILLEFPWDRGAGKDAGSKHRVHVASVWAGGKWGFVQIPRVGQEVLVEYFEGEVDRPIVTGRVYNSALNYPYALPDDKTQSGWKSQTLDGGSDNFNEIRFDDKKGSEHINVQAEKDLMTLVKNDETRTVNHDRTTTIKNHDTRTVKEGNDTHTIEKGNQSTTVSKGNQSITVTQGNQDTKISTGNRTVTIEKGNDTLAVKMGNISIKADLGSITVEAMQKIELKVGSNKITIDMMGVKIEGMNVKSEAKIAHESKGLMTKVEGQAMTEVKAPMTQVKGDAMLMMKGGITMIN